MKPPPLALLQRSARPVTTPDDESGLLRAEGPSFPLMAKILATAFVLALLVLGVQFMQQHQGPDVQTGLTAGQWGFLAAVGVVIGAGYWGILTSRTRITEESIEQTWLWRKHVALKDITQVKLVRVPGLEALIVPRLVVRSGWGLTTFQTGDPAVLALFRRLAHGTVV
jgi:hypothetical protein